MEGDWIAMELPPFLLDHWLAAHEFNEPPIRYNLASSTGPRWTLEELERLPVGRLDIARTAIGYAPPDGARDLREAIAEHHAVDPDWVVVMTGASEALSALFCLASEQEANVVLPTPSFPAFGALGGAWRLGVRTYALRRENGFRQSADDVQHAVDDHTVLALVNTPHNPTGAVIERSEVERLAAALGARGITLVVDEVYHPLYFGGDLKSAAGLENVIVVGDMSKAMSLAGVRIGWLIDANPERRKRIIDARSYFTISSSPLSEAIAAHALRNRASILARLNDVASANLSLLREAIGKAGDILSWVPPAGGTTCFPWFTDGRDSRAVCERLVRGGVLVVPGDCFGEPDHMRIGYGAQIEGFSTAVEIIGNALAE
jgi:aspartate/methionine/tyrosine aminotransferase